MRILRFWLCRECSVLFQQVLKVIAPQFAVTLLGHQSSALLSLASSASAERVQAIIAITALVSMLLSLSSIIAGLGLLKMSGSGRARSEQALVNTSSHPRHADVDFDTVSLSWTIPLLAGRTLRRSGEVLYSLCSFDV